MGKKAGNRKHSKIDALDPALRETVEQMLLSGSTYSEIVDFLGANGVGISVASVCRYARAYQAEVQMLNMAQENFRRMMDELDKYPDLDTTEAIIRLTSQNLLTALANTSEEDWQGVSIDKMLREANALVRAAAEAGHTVALMSPYDGCERQALCGQIIAGHASTTVDNRGYLLIFNNHLPKQHFRI